MFVHALNQLLELPHDGIILDRDFLCTLLDIIVSQIVLQQRNNQPLRMHDFQQELRRVALLPLVPALEVSVDALLQYHVQSLQLIPIDVADHTSLQDDLLSHGNEVQLFLTLDD